MYSIKANRIKYMSLKMGKQFFFSTKNTNNNILTNSSPHVFLSTVKDNIQYYGKIDVEHVRKAKNLQEWLGWPTTRNLVKIMHNNQIINYPLTGDDLLQEGEIFGPSIGMIKGRTTRNQPTEKSMKYAYRTNQN